MIRKAMEPRRERTGGGKGEGREERRKRKDGEGKQKEEGKSTLPPTTLRECEKDSWLSLIIYFSLSSIVIAVLTMHVRLHF